jgi:hypothetical protein
MAETNLTINDFSKYFERDKLGKLYFPNGHCFDNGEKVPFHIELSNLYKLTTGWKINKLEVPLDSIVGIISFGSAVKYPGSTIEIKKGKKFGFFGPEIVKKCIYTPIQPNDADFLIITDKNLFEDKILKPVSLETYDCGTWVKEGGIHLVYRGIEQVVNGIDAEDTISISAMKEGVPIFYTEALTALQDRIKMQNMTPRKLNWNTGKEGYLGGIID